jgi:cysteine sulfinate desulfinase/cysteine desulfurase-like protein
MGRSAREVRGSLRASLGVTSTSGDVEVFIERLREAVERLSALAPPAAGIGNPYQGG